MAHFRITAVTILTVTKKYDIVTIHNDTFIITIIIVIMIITTTVTIVELHTDHHNRAHPMATDSRESRVEGES